MQLRNNLYTVTQRAVEGLTGSYTLELQPSCVIYQAHFPGRPITPGVCIVQICQELLEDMLLCAGLPHTTKIAMVKNVKFLSVLSPDEDTAVVYQMKKVELSEDNTELKAQVVVSAGEEAKAKISLVLKVTDAE